MRSIARKFPLILLLPVIYFLPACSMPDLISGSGNVITKDYDLSGFSSVNASNGFKVKITCSDMYSVSVTADDNLFNNLDVRVQNETLKVSLDPAYSYLMATKRIQITMPEINELRLAAGAGGTIIEFPSAERFLADLSLGSRLDGTLETDSAYFTLSSGSTLELEGSAKEMILQSSAGSSADLTEFIITNGKVNLSSGSSATIHINGTLDVNLSGASTLNYLGEPDLGTISISRGSEMKQRQNEF
jgi:hypothetical protein